MSGRSNGINADGSLMNVGNKLGSRPSIRLFNQYSRGDAMRDALTDDGMGYDHEPVRHCICLAFPLRSWLRHRLSLRSSRARRQRRGHCLIPAAGSLTPAGRPQAGRPATCSRATETGGTTPGHRGRPKSMTQPASPPERATCRSGSTLRATGESWQTAAIPMDNRCCSCKLTRLLDRRQARCLKRTSSVGAARRAREPSGGGGGGAGPGRGHGPDRGIAAGRERRDRAAGAGTMAGTTRQSPKLHAKLPQM